MKSKFTTVDIIAIVAELNDRLAGMRVAQVYDADHKTYLLKLQRPEQKAVLLLESGARIHATEYEWPKNPAPSGFSMKLRKHIRNKRLESIRQLGVDRVVDLQFGSAEVAHHVILELYDRGNIVLTDHQYTILNILRPRTDAESVRFASKENYPLDKARLYETRTEQQLREVVTAAKEGELLKRVINPHLDFGSALIEHLLLEAGFPPQARVGHEFNAENDMHRLMTAVRAGEAVLRNEQQDFKGIVTYRTEKRSAGGQKTKGDSVGGQEPTEVLTYQEFHPLLYAQHADQPHHTFLSFTAAVDEFFSKLESQKLDMKAVQQERDALKKLDNVRRDHQRRLEALELAQRDDRWRAELITNNASLVDGAALVVRSALANQIDWREIGRIVQEAQKRGDPVARSIKALKLDTNHITMLLHDPYQEESEEEEDDNEDGGECDGGGGEDGAPPKTEKKEESSSHIRPMLVDIDLDLSALANATRYFGQKRTAAKKQQKTIESSYKAMKSAEQKTKQTLKEAATIASINKARRVHWFERFLWFISSENYLVLGGRDQQQNEILVRRYLKPGDIYVHGDLHGAASLVVKNPGGGDVPPKTLNEAGAFAVCNSSAWDAKIVTSAWWVHAHQVSKTAPTGEYLTTGSFMVRGKKNYLPPCQLALGFGVLFKLEESSIERHRGERRVRTVEAEDAPRSGAVGEEPSSASVTGTEDGAGGEDDAAGSSQDGEEDKEESEDGEKRNSEGEEEEGKKEEKDSEEEEEGEKENKKSESEDENEFPDTNVEVKHLKGSKFTVEVTSPTDSKPSDNPFPKLPGPKPAAQRRGKQQQTAPPSTGKDKKQNCGPAPQPRGKRSKMKRAKEKYRDQDEEEREARMAILQSAGRSQAAVAEEKRQQEVQEREQRQKEVKERRQQQAKARQEAADDDGDDDEATVPQDCQVLDELTGVPVDEDELLYAVPVCAPWATVLGYKFKVKLTPSAGKKGKAAKTAVQSFLTDKVASPRERDLLKSVRLEDVTRNFPGKVKVVLPQAARAKKK